MGFLGYLLLGSIVYVVGFTIHLKILTPKRQQGSDLTLTHPLIIQLLMACFVMMLLVSILIGKFILHHQQFDWLFIGINSMVATVIFYFALCPDQKPMDLP